MNMYQITLDQQTVDKLHAAIALALKAAPTQQTSSELARLMVWLENQVMECDRKRAEEEEKAKIERAIAEAKKDE
jgi:hypothetical protein